VRSARAPWRASRSVISFAALSTGARVLLGVTQGR
jgi:hypothetical protein